MKTTKHLLIMLLVCVSNLGYSQSIDSLNVSPNPFNTSTTVNLWLANNDTVSVEMYNAFGQSVSTILQDSFMTAGAHAIRVPTDTLAPAFYFVSLSVGSKKAIVNKALKSATASTPESVGQKAQLLVWPNPTDNHLNISANGKKRIVISSLNGQLVKKIQTDERFILLSGLGAGTYLISVFSAENKLLFSERVIKVEPK